MPGPLGKSLEQRGNERQHTGPPAQGTGPAHFLLASTPAEATARAPGGTFRVPTTRKLPGHTSRMLFQVLAKGKIYNPDEGHLKFKL